MILDKFYVIYGSKKYSGRETDRQTLKCPLTTILTIVPQGKQNLSKEKKKQ